MNILLNLDKQPNQFAGDLVLSSTSRVIPALPFGTNQVRENGSFTIELYSSDLSETTSVSLKMGVDPNNRALFPVVQDSAGEDITFDLVAGTMVTRTFYGNYNDYFYFEVASGVTGTISYRLNLN